MSESELRSVHTRDRFLAVLAILVTVAIIVVMRL